MNKTSFIKHEKIARHKIKINKTQIDILITSLLISYRFLIISSDTQQLDFKLEVNCK
jgi:hypothetical protein